MYEEADYKFDWQNTLKKLIIVLLIGISFFIIFLFINKDKTTYFDDNIKTMSAVAKNYYSQNEEIKEQITLKEMIDKKMLNEFIDENGKTCDLNNSYAQINNKTIKIKLTCSTNQDIKEITI